jgi:hypothetical protein
MKALRDSSSALHTDRKADSTKARTIAIGNRLTFFGGDMNDRQQTPAEVGKGDREEVRTKDNPIGGDDIGLPSGMPKDDVSRLEEIRPDPGKANDKS